MEGAVKTVEEINSLKGDKQCCQAVPVHSGVDEVDIFILPLQHSSSC